MASTRTGSRRVALVSGGSRGIGASICLRLAADGFDVAVNYRRDEDAATAVVAQAERFGVRARAYRADVASYDEDTAMVEQVVTDMGRLDALVCNAGIASRGHTVADTDPAEPARVIGVHAVGAHYLTSLALPYLRQHERSDIVLISSTAATRPSPGGAPYMMAKAALEALGRTLALEEAANGVRVNIVAPGLTVTEMGNRLARAVVDVSGAADLDSTTPFGRVTRPEDVAAVVAFLVSADAAMVTGQRIEVHAGMTGWRSHRERSSRRLSARERVSDRYPRLDRAGHPACTESVILIEVPVQYTLGPSWSRCCGRRSPMEKIWANSADSHFLEPEGLWRENLPPRLAALVPRSEKDPDGEWETVHIDGMSFRRKLPTGKHKEFYEASNRAPGARDINLRMKDLDQEGIWAELVFPSLGMWNASFRTPEVLREALRVSNDWAFETIDKAQPRLISTAQIPTLDISDAVAELERCAEKGFRAVFLPVQPHPLQKDWHMNDWEPFWAAAEAARMVLAFHIGTDPLDLSKGARPGVVYRGPGGAVLNYTETTFGGQRVVMKLVASGVLDRHPNLKILIAEGGATWVPFIADRMIEGYRQHAMAVHPKLKRDIREIIYTQVYASFQHDESAVAVAEHMGYHNVLWGSDYPHMEGTYGHTQETLHRLFDGVNPKLRERITQGAFNELFPGLPPAPASAARA